MNEQSRNVVARVRGKHRCCALGVRFSTEFGDREGRASVSTRALTERCCFLLALRFDVAEFATSPSDSVSVI